MSETLNHPPITFKAGEFEIKWVYGLEQDLLRMVPSAESLVDVILNNAFVRDYIVRRTLTKIAGFVQDPETELIDPVLVTLTRLEQMELIDWIAGHLMFFFVNSASRLTEVAKKYQAQTQLMIQSARSEPGSTT